MDLLWLVIPAAVGLFLARTVMIARRLKAAAANPTLADVRALREARRGLQTHRARLDEAVASRREHLESAKRLARPPAPRSQGRESQVGHMVEDFLPERRF